MSGLASPIRPSNNDCMDNDEDEAKRLAEELARIEKECEQTIEEIKADTTVDSIKKQQAFLLACGIGEERPMPYVYFIRCSTTGFYKIGVSQDPRKRLAQLQVGSATRLSLRLTIKSGRAEELEKELHDHFARGRVRGEWFMIDNEAFALLRAGELPGKARR